MAAKICKMGRFLEFTNSSAHPQTVDQATDKQIICLVAHRLLINHTIAYIQSGPEIVEGEPLQSATGGQRQLIGMVNLCGANNTFYYNFTFTRTH